jgi:ABC-type transport system involved in multi-copper enzyme maturation permease subunit
VVTRTAEAGLTAAPSPVRAFFVLALHSFQRHWRLRQMGWVSLGLLAILVTWVSAISFSPAEWGLENRRVRRTRITYQEYADQLTPEGRYRTLHDWKVVAEQRGVSGYETPTPLSRVREGLSNLVLSIPKAVLSSEKFRQNWRFTNYAKWVILGAYLGFVLPMFTLAYASGAIGTEREGRSLIWLMTRPMPRSAIYLAKYLGALPWCLLVSLGGFAALCVAGGEPGRIALGLFWPAALAGTLAFSALFHLFGAMFRWPVVVGLVYVFFFEILVAALPGSLKLLSLTFYVRSLMYNEAVAAGYPGAMLEVAAPVSNETAIGVLAVAFFGLTALGMRLFSRAEHRDDV